MAQHLLRIREQLAHEWQQDLGLLPLCNAELRRHRSEQVAHLSDELENLQYQISPGSIEGDEGNGSPLRSANFDLLKTARDACLTGAVPTACRPALSGQHRPIAGCA